MSKLKVSFYLKQKRFQVFFLLDLIAVRFLSNFYHWMALIKCEREWFSAKKYRSPMIGGLIKHQKVGMETMKLIFDWWEAVYEILKLIFEFFYQDLFTISLAIKYTLDHDFTIKYLHHQFFKLVSRVVIKNSQVKTCS